MPRRHVDRHEDLGLSAGEAAARALRMVGKRVDYRYGAGGTDPRAPHPAGQGVFACDCTGFTSWCQGHDRWLKNAKGEAFWVSSATLVGSPKATHGRYRPVWQPEVGDVLAYAANPKRGVPYGHAGIVTSISPKSPAEWDPLLKACWQGVNVTHCHSTGTRIAPAVTTEPAWRLFGAKWGKPGGTAILRSVTK